MAQPHIVCGACGHKHATVTDVYFCHIEQDKFPIMDEEDEKQQKSETPFRHFPTRQEAEEFISNNPGSRRVGAVKVKYINVFNQETEKYETKKEETYTVRL